MKKRFLSSCMLVMSLFVAQQSHPAIEFPLTISTLHQFDRSLRGKVKAFFTKVIAGYFNSVGYLFFRLHQAFYGNYVHLFECDKDLDKTIQDLKKEFNTSKSPLWQKLQNYSSIQQIVDDLLAKEARLENELMAELEAILKEQNKSEVFDEIKNEHARLVRWDYKSSTKRYTVHHKSPVTEYIKTIIKRCGVDPDYVSIYFDYRLAPDDFMSSANEKDKGIYHCELFFPTKLVKYKKDIILKFCLVHELSHCLLKHSIKKRLIRFINDRCSIISFPKELNLKFEIYLRNQELLCDVYLLAYLQNNGSYSFCRSVVKNSLFFIACLLNYRYEDYKVGWEEDDTSSYSHPHPLIRFAYLVRIQELLNQ